MTEIRNYQGKVPKGIWYCYSCEYDTTDVQEAAQHAENNNDWMWLFPVDKGITNNTKALFELHASDYGGVYLSPSKYAFTWERFYKLRKFHIERLEGQQREHVR